MNVYGRNRLTWEENDLYFQDELIVSIVPDKVYPEMFRVRWKDGIESKIPYNKTRAKDHCYNLALEFINNRAEDKILKV